MHDLKALGAYIETLKQELLDAEDCRITDDIHEFNPEKALAYLWPDSEDEAEHDQLVSQQFPIAAGLYQFCCDYHGGQETRLYQILSCLHCDPVMYKPSISGELEEDDQEVYDALERWYKKHLAGEYGWDDSLKTGHPLEPRVEDTDVN